MTPLERAIAICGTQSELARRVTGKAATGHVYHWRNNGISEEVAIAIERAQRAVVAESLEAAARADELGGIAAVELLRPDRDWERDAAGEITGYLVPVAPPEIEDPNVYRSPAADAGDAAETAPASSLRAA